MEHGPSRDGLSVGATHSEGARSVRTIFHQRHDIPRAHTGEECVALLGGSHLPEGEAFPVIAPDCWPSC